MTEKTENMDKRLTRLERQGVGADAGKSNDFLVARKFLVLAPCEPNENSVRNFLQKGMEIPDEIVATLRVDNMERVFQRNLPQHRKKDNRPRTKIELGSIDKRDMVMSHATNLSIGTSVDIVVPDHLKVTAMKLDHHAFKMRKMSKMASNGVKENEIKTQVRFNNKSENLVLGVRTDGEWEFFQPGNLPPTGDPSGMGSTSGIHTV